MKKLLTILFVLSAAAAGAQIKYVPSYTPWDFGKIKAKALRLPSDTLADADSNSIALVNGVIYAKSSRWMPWSGGSAFDTASLLQKINQKQDLLGYTPVPNTRKINGLPLSSDITIDKGLVGLDKVPNKDATVPSNIQWSGDYRTVTDNEKAAIYGSVKNVISDTTAGTMTIQKNDGSSNVVLLPKGGGSSGTATPANSANAYFDDAQGGTFPGKAQISEDGNTVYGLLDNNTGSLTEWKKVSTWVDGSAMNDSRIDGAIYRKKGIAYYKRVFEGPVQASWFLKPGTPDNTGSGQSANGLRLQVALDLIAAMPNGGVLEFGQGDFYFTPTNARTYGIMVHSNTTLSSKQGARLICGTTNMGTYKFVYLYMATNVTIDGLTMIGDRETNIGDGSYHADGSYYGGESGMGVYLDGTTDVHLLNLHLSKFWGDGVYIGNRICYNTVIDNCYADWNRRNGITATWAENIQISNSYFINTKGTPPEAGIDIEPNEGTWVRNVNLTNVAANNNNGGGITSSGSNIIATNITAEGNGNMGMAQAGLNVNHHENTGFILNGANLNFNGGNGLTLDGSSGMISVKGLHANGNGTLKVLANNTTTKPQIGDIYSYGGEYILTLPQADTLPGLGSIYQDASFQYVITDTWDDGGDTYVIVRMNNSPLGFPVTGRAGTITKVSGTGKNSYTFSRLKTTGEINFAVKGIRSGGGIDTLILRTVRVNGVSLPPRTGGTLVRTQGSGDAAITYSSWYGIYPTDSLKNDYVGYGASIYSIVGDIKIDGSIFLNNINSGINQNFFTKSDINLTNNSISGNGNGVILKNNNGKFSGNTVAYNDNITGNDGAVVLYGDHWSLQGNFIEYNKRTGLYVWSNDNTIIGNDIIGNSQEADATYNNITVSGWNSRNTLQSNRIAKAKWGNQPAYGVRFLTGIGTGNSAINNVPAAGMAKSGDILNEQTGNIIQVPGGAGGSGGDLTDYLKLSGRIGGQSATIGVNSGDPFRISTNPYGNGKIYLGKWNNRNYYDEFTGNFSLDSNRLYVDGSGTYIGKFYDNNTQKLTLKNTGLTLTGTQGGWAVEHSVEDYLHNKLGGMGAYGTGTSLTYLYMSDAYNGTWGIRANSANVTVLNQFKLNNVSDNNGAGLKMVVRDPVSGGIYQQNLPAAPYGLIPYGNSTGTGFTSTNAFAFSDVFSQLKITPNRTAGPEPFMFLNGGKDANNGAVAEYGRGNSSQQALHAFTTAGQFDGYIGTLPGVTKQITIATSGGNAGDGFFRFDNTKGFGVGTGDSAYTWFGKDGSAKFNTLAGTGVRMVVADGFGNLSAQAIPSGGSGTPSWGSIIGTLSSQTDLQTALNGKENAFTKNTAFNKNFGTSAGTITEGNDSRVLNGQTAFGWGNHASQGYLKNITGLINFTGSATVTGAGTVASPYSVNIAGGTGGSTTLYSATGANTDGAMTQAATTTELAKKSDAAPADYTIQKVGSTYYAYPAPNSGLTAYSNTDAYTVIQSAINALTTTTTRGKGGGKIVIGTGDFTLSNELQIIGWETQGNSNPGYSQLTIQGSSKATRIIQNTAGKNAIVIKNNASVELLDMRIECGSAARSAIRFDGTGTDEISCFGGKFDNLYLMASSTTYPALYMQNFFDCVFGTITAQNTNYDAIILENASTTTLYGNSHFGFIRAIASTSAGYAGLRIRSTDGANYRALDLITFANYQCVNGYYGVYISDGSNLTFGMVDIEYGTVGFHIGGGTYARNNYVKSGLISVAATTGKCIEASLGGNTFVCNLGGGTSAIPIYDTQTFEPPNSYDVNLTNNNAANIAITQASRTYLRYKQPSDGRTYTRLGDNVTATTQATSDNSTAVATTAFVKAQNYITSASVPTYTASNIGTSANGFGVFSSKVGNDFQFKRLLPGTNFEIVDGGGYLQLNATSTGGAAYTVATATVSSDYTVPAGGYMVKLPDLTISGTNRNIVLPSANSNQGKTILIVNANNTSTVWVFSGATVKDIQNSTITNVPNNVAVTLVSDGVNWIKTY